MALKAILFDLDDTLVMDEASVEKAFLATCELMRSRYGVEPRSLMQSVRERAQELWRAADTIDYCRSIGTSSWEGLWADYSDYFGNDPNLRKLEAWAPTYRREAWHRGLLGHGIDNRSLAEELAQRFVEERKQWHVLFPKAEEVLEKLHDSFVLGLVTNGPPALQRQKIHGAGIEHFFNVIVISGELGFGKPDPRIFAIALEKLFVDPSEALMVGNSLERDIQGAQEMGIKGVYVDRGDNESSDVIPFARISRLDQLLEKGSTLFP